MAKKSYFKKTQSNQVQTQTQQANGGSAGDLNGDGKEDWIDAMLSIVMFIQTARGQMFVMVAAAVFSAAINMPSYTKTVGAALALFNAVWMLPFIWLISFLVWAVFQVCEVLPRTGFWDFETKVAIVKSLQGAGLPLKDYDPKSGQQTDLVYWQDITINDAKMRRLLFWAVSIVAHLADAGMLWADFPLIDKNFLPIGLNILIVVFLMFSFEGSVGIAQSIKQLRKGYSV